MQDLHLVGFTKDRRHLIFSTRKGAKSGSFLVPVDEDLIDAVDEVASYAADHDAGAEPPDPPPVEERSPSQPRVESSLTVKEVQTRLRAGESVEAVATDAGVDPGWVERFAAPVRAEQRRIVERAMVSHLQRPRAGTSAVPLRQAITAAMAERKVHMSEEQFESAWHSHVEAPGRWVVGFTFLNRGKSRTLTWDFDVASGRLTTSDRFASQLGFRSADDLPLENSTVEDASTPGGRRSGGLAIPGTTKAPPASEANVPRRPSPPVAPRRPAPPPTASATPPSRPSVPSSPPVRPRDVDGRPPRGRAESPARPAAAEMQRPPTGGSPAPTPPRRPIQEPRDGGVPPVEPRRPDAPVDRRPDSVRRDSPGGPPPATRRPAPPSRPPPARTVSAPAASMEPVAPAPQRQPRRDLDLPPPVRRPAPVATDASRAVDEDDMEIAPSLRVIATEEESSVRLIPAPGSDDAEPSDSGPGAAAEPEPQVGDESSRDADDDLVDDDVRDDDVDDEDDLAEDDLEDVRAEDDLEDAEGDFDEPEEDLDEPDDEYEVDQNDDIDDVDDLDDEHEPVSPDADGADDIHELDDADEIDGEGDLIESEGGDVEDDEISDDEIGDDEDREPAEEPAAAEGRDVDEPPPDDADEDSEGDDVTTEAVTDRASLGRVRLVTEADRERSTSAGDDREELHPRRRTMERRPRRSQPIVGPRGDAPADESRASGGTEPEGTVRRSSAQFNTGFATVAGADARDGAEQNVRRDAPPAPEQTEEAEKSRSKGDIESPEGGEPGRGEARPQRRRQPSEKSQPPAKKPRRRRSQPLRAR